MLNHYDGHDWAVTEIQYVEFKTVIELNFF